MGILPRLRRQRLWLALASLACCLPWLVTACGGRCGLDRCSPAVAATVEREQPESDYCSRCCPTTIPALADVAFCCEASKAGLPLAVNPSELGPPTSRGHAPGGAAFPGLFAFAFIDIGFSGTIRIPGPSRPMPPSAFLRTVARRCFPSHAPPLSTARLS